MKRSTVIVLFVVVLLLGSVAWREWRAEQREQAAGDVALFEGVDTARVKRISIENLARDQHMVFDRDERGRWRMSEPTSVPADQALVDWLLKSALERRGTPVPPAEARAEDLGLDPPRVIFEIEEEDRGGERRRSRVDLGAVDLDGSHLNVRARGLLLRTWRDLDTTLDRSVEDFMVHDIGSLSPPEVVEVHRRGSLVRGSATQASDLTFDALLEDGTWRATAPVAAPLDPQAAGLYVQGVATLKAKRFADFGRRLLADFGLDPPEIALTLSGVSSQNETLRFGRPGHKAGATWHCSLEGEPYVWLVEPRAVEFFAIAVDELVDKSLTRIPVQAVDGLVLALEGRELRLWREKRTGREAATWKVSERPTREAAFTPGTDADAAKVEDLLGKIAGAEIAKFLHGEALSADEVRGSLVVQSGDLRQGGSLGAEVGVPEGGRALRYQRTGDSAAGWVDTALLDLFRTPAVELFSLRLFDLPEVEQRELSLAGKGVEKRYARGSKGLWTRSGSAIEARELHGVLDALTIVRATRHLGGDPQRAPLSDPIRVEFTNLAGEKLGYAIGIAEEAAQAERVQIAIEARRAVLKDQALHRRLTEVLEQP